MSRAGLNTLSKRAPEDVGAQLRALIDGCRDEEDVEGERVLIDMDVDGARYLLVRMPAAARDTASLSPREAEIVRLVAAGHPNKVIAAVLDISAWTVCTHIRRVFVKMGVTSRAAMVARAREVPAYDAHSTITPRKSA